MVGGKRGLQVARKWPFVGPVASSVLLLLAMIGLLGCGSGSTIDSIPSSSGEMTFAPTTTSSLAGTISTPAVDTTSLISSPPTTGGQGYPVLRELPLFSLKDLALIEVWGSEANRVSSSRLRLISPAAEPEEAQDLLSAYGRIILDPNSGYPVYAMERPVIYNVVFRLLDGREVMALLGAPGQPSSVGYVAEGIVDKSSAMPHSYCAAPELISTAQQLLDKWPPAVDATSSLPIEMPQDFSLIAAYGVTMKNMLDTFSGTFTKDLIGAVPSTATTGLALTQAELHNIYRGLRDMEILSYPSEFQPKSESSVQPHESYLLYFRANGVTKQIHWEDGTMSAEPQANSLRAWFERVKQLIEAKAEYKALPAAEGGYE